MQVIGPNLDIAESMTTGVERYGASIGDAVVSIGDHRAARSWRLKLSARRPSRFGRRTKVLQVSARRQSDALVIATLILINL